MRADHLVCVRRCAGVEMYSHHGIDLGDGRVIHYTGEPGRKADACIAITSFSDFSAGDPVEVVEYGTCDEAEVVVARAMQRLGESSYNVVTNNCEHFARWCKTGQATSKQVRDKGGKSAVTTLAGASATAAVGVVSVTGTVAGLSGAGVMSGLAAVGGSAVGGLAALGAAPGAVGTMILNRTVFKHDEHAPEDEQAACHAARWGTRTGTVAGGAAAVGVVSAAGVTGLSAAGITSGLAAIGGVVGGGMVAGTALVVAAPLAGAAAIGGAVYGVMRLVRRRR